MRSIFPRSVWCFDRYPAGCHRCRHPRGRCKEKPSLPNARPPPLWLGKWLITVKRMFSIVGSAKLRCAEAVNSAMTVCSWAPAVARVIHVETSLLHSSDEKQAEQASFSSGSESVLPLRPKRPTPHGVPLL